MQGKRTATSRRLTTTKLHWGSRYRVTKIGILCGDQPLAGMLHPLERRLTRCGRDSPPDTRSFIPLSLNVSTYHLFTES